MSILPVFHYYFSLSLTYGKNFPNARLLKDEQVAMVSWVTGSRQRYLAELRMPLLLVADILSTVVVVRVHNLAGPSGPGRCHD